MIHGIDTGFLVAVELQEHPGYTRSREQLQELVHAGHTFAIAPQVLLEFIHVVTDPRRFTAPLSVDEARALALKWWTAAEVSRVFPNEAALHQFFRWHEQLQLGRKRLLDTLLAATYAQAGAQSLLTTNPDDFSGFGIFSFITPNTP